MNIEIVFFVLSMSIVYNNDHFVIIMTIHHMHFSLDNNLIMVYRVKSTLDRI